jgi:hypothetical protein
MDPTQLASRHSYQISKEKQMIRSEFGFLRNPLTIIVGDITIEPRADFDQAVAGLAEWDGIEGDWIYAPPQRVLASFGRQARELPYPSRVFGLPKTHIISLGNGEDDRLHFEMWALSFFLGIRLTTTEAGFLDATPINPGTLIDFNVPQRHLPKVLALANAFWLSHRGEPSRAKRFGAAVHALFLGQSPHYLQFEQFMFLYTALDACYALAASIFNLGRNLPHSDRIAWMCDRFRMSTPDWAVREDSSLAEIAKMRNEAIHEALFADEPLGFAIHGVGSNRNLPLEMRCLICRLLVAMIGGAAASYVKSPVNTRMRYGLDLS